MEKTRCVHCQGKAVKNGFHNKKQRYKCSVCHRRFQKLYTYRAYKTDTGPLIRTLLKEGCGIRSIARIIKISTKTVLSRMLKISRQIEMTSFDKPGCVYEVDELFVKIANGNSQNWIAYALERESKSVIGFTIGNRSKENIGQLINKLLLLRPQKIYTDRLNIYPSLIPKQIHKQFKYCTNGIERYNLTLRTHIKRLARRTICFSRKQEYLEAHLKIYFWS